MLRIVLSIYLLSTFILANGQLAMNDANAFGSSVGPAANSSEVPIKLNRKFRRDAARIALRMESGIEDLRFQNIAIPKERIDEILYILQKVYLSGERGKAISRCNVHTFPNPAIDHFKIVFDNTVEWAELLNEGISETTNETFNELLDEYDLVIENHEKWTDEQDILVVRSSSPLNMAALANEFYNIEGIIEIDLGIPELSGNDIQFIKSANGWEIHYVLTIGGSLLQTTKKEHIWIFEVDQAGEVKFLSEEGEPIPDWMKCEEDVFIGRG